MVLITLALLIYVHQQTLVFQTSYSIEKKERQVARLSEDYKNAKFSVARLRSPHALNERMKKLSLDLIAPKDHQIIRLVKPKEVPAPTKMGWSAPVQFMSWLHFVREAHAKTTHRE